MRKHSYYTVTDQFCGCGGSTKGAKNAGAEVLLGLNHNKLAIASYSANNPEADVDCADVSNTNPRRYKSTDILITSPECDYHTDANGRAKPKKQMSLFEKNQFDAAADRSRMTMFDVPRFAEYHDYNYIIVENVWQARKWIQFDNWLRTMHTLGYKHKIVYFNSMFSWPTPQSRDRMYIHFWKKGNKAPDLNYHPLAYCPRCEKDILSVQCWKRPDAKFGVYGAKRGQYIYCCPNHGTIVEPYYYAAFNCIDWSDIGEPVLDRKRGDLSPNTIRRIKIGLEKFGNAPFSIKLEHSKQENIRHIAQALYAQTSTDSQGFVTPMIIELNGTGTVRPAINHLSTVTSAYGKHGLLWPFIIENKGQSTARSMNDAISSFTSNVHHGILTPDSFKSFISYYNSGSDVNSYITQPVGTFTGVDRAYLANSQTPTLEDCYYRSLKAHEVKIGMGFDKDYIVLGNSKEQVWQCGNAVTPPAMEWQIKRAIESLN